MKLGVASIGKPPLLRRDTLFLCNTAGPNSTEAYERMNWDKAKGQWTQMKGSIRKQWGKITDDDLDVINGERERWWARSKRALWHRQR